MHILLLPLLSFACFLLIFWKALPFRSEWLVARYTTYDFAIFATLPLSSIAAYARMLVATRLYVDRVRKQSL